MDQHTNHDILDVRSRAARGGDAVPYGLPALALSLLAILVLTALYAGLCAATVGLVQLAVLGMQAMRSFYLSLQFDIPTQTELSALAVTVVYVCLVGATLSLALYKDRARWPDLLALRPVAAGWRRNFSIAAMVLLYAALATLALAKLHERHVPLDGPTDTLLVVLLTANYAIFAPCAEELLFRGWIYTALRRRLRFGTTVFATSLVFAAIHWEPRHMVLVLPLAFALGFIREQSGSIKPTIALHATYNVVIVTITLLTQ